MRDFDLVLFGATGFTGGLTAEYLTRHAPDGLRWALAGRNRAKLESVRERLATIGPDGTQPALLTADTDRSDTLRDVAARTRVLASTVGPYVQHGDPVVAACADAGTDYADLCGEPEFVDQTYLRHHARAVGTGARLVHACGFDSVPYDLGVLATVRALPGDGPIHVDGYVRTGAAFSAGTYHSAVLAMGRRRLAADAANRRRRLEPRPADRRVSARPGRLHRSATARGWVLPLPTIDPKVVGRSARALPEYGPEFSYRHHLAVRRLRTALRLGGTVAAMTALAQVPPARRWLLGRMDPGDGPSPQRRARSWFRATFVGRRGGRTAVTTVAGGDPGYDETAKMLAESALCLALDDNPPSAGQVTTAAAMGDTLTARLRAAGITVDVDVGG